jgi:hypothetical protein
VLAGEFGERAAGLVAAVTSPIPEPGRDRHEQYRQHVTASLEATPWARVIKVSDFTDNAVGLFYTTGPKLPRLAAKYRPLVPSAQCDQAGSASPRPVPGDPFLISRTGAW